MRSFSVSSSISFSIPHLVCALVTLVGACGGAAPAPSALPMLPGDGDSHVAKPPPAAPARPASAPDPWAGRGDQIAVPMPGAPAAIELPKLDEFKLGNGLAVYVVRTTRLPVMSLRLAIRAGRMHEPRARLGVAELAADLLVKGTRTRDAAQLARAIDAVGGTIAADATFEATLVSCSALARSADACFSLVSDMVTQPAFPDAEVARVRDGLIAKLQQRIDDAPTLASAHVQNLLWGNDHVRGWINSQQSFAALHREDVTAWHRAWFVPGNAMLVITGDVDARKLRGELERTFGAWRKGPVPPAPTYPEPSLSGSRVRLVDMPGQTQAQIRIGQFGIRHDDPRFFDALVWNHALGGGPGSRLARAVRGDGSPDNQGGSGFDRNADRGSFVASATTRGADAIAATKRMLAEIARMAKDGPTPDEIGAAVVGITGGYGLRFQVAADYSAALVGAELHGFGHEYLSNFPVAVGQVGVADAKRAAAEILDPKAYVIVLLGDAKDLEPALAKEGWRYEKVAYTDPVTAPYTPPDVPADAKVLAGLHKLVDDALAARGGKARLAALKAFRLSATGTTTVSGQQLPVEIARVFVLPDRMRIDATIKPPGGRDVQISVAAAGKAGWQRGPDGAGGSYAVTELAGNALATVDFERWREPELILLKAADPQARLAALADDTIDGKPCAVFKLRVPQTQIDVALYVDKKTKLVARMSYSDGGNVETDNFSDYRDVGGIKFAFQRSTSGGGRSTALVLTKVEIDPEIAPSVFDKPAK